MLNHCAIILWSKLASRFNRAHRLVAYPLPYTTFVAQSEQNNNRGDYKETLKDDLLFERYGCGK